MKVAIITSHLAHYRHHLYSILDAAPGVEVTHFSGGPSKRGISSIDPSELKRVAPVKDIELFGFHWQRGVLRVAFESKFGAYIFTGDVRYISTWLASSILKIKRKRVYFWTIGWHRPEKGIRNLLRLSFYKLADKLLLYGDAEMRLAIKQGYPSNKIAVIYNSVSNIEDINTMEIASCKKERSVGAIARLSSVKNFGLLIDAVSILKSRGENVNVIFGGDGPERSALKAKAEQLGIRCEFLGAVHDDEKIANFYRRVSVTIMPSVAGLTTIQSLSHGVPVITDNNELTQAPEANAIQPGVTGSRYEAGSAEALANEIRNWQEKIEDDPIAVAKQCEEEVRSRWSPTVQAKRMLQAIGATHDSEDGQKPN